VRYRATVLIAAINEWLWPLNRPSPARPAGSLPVAASHRGIRL